MTTILYMFFPNIGGESTVGPGGTLTVATVMVPGLAASRTMVPGMPAAQVRQ